MAESLATKVDAANVAIRGRRLKLNNDNFLVGTKGIEKNVTNATSGSTGTNLVNHGYHTLQTSTNDTWKLDSPKAGLHVVIGLHSTSTGTHTVNHASTVTKFITAKGTSKTSLEFKGLGAGAQLFGLSTSQWLVKDHVDNTANFYTASSASTGVNIPNHGVVFVTGSASTQTFKLAAPEVDKLVTLVRSVVATSTQTITLASGTIIHSTGVNGASIALGLRGDQITLRGASTAKWVVVAATGAPVTS